MKKKIIKKRQHKWKFVSEFPIKEYVCGLKAGQKVKLKFDIVMEDHKGDPTGIIFPAGEIWTVIMGSKEPPKVVWFRQKNGEVHTWDDDQRIFNSFEVIE